MSALKVVLLAEGNGEVGPNAQRGPGSPVAVDDWAPGHELFARAIAHGTKIPREAVRFLEPLRTGRGGVAKGSNLLHDKTLRRLLGYLPAFRPDLAIVLVDADGEPTRKRKLEGILHDIPGNKLIAVATQEFESWLVGDPAALTAVLGVDANRAPPHPERLAPSAAKALLTELTASNEDPRLARLNLARHLDLEAVSGRCASFATCLDELQALKL
jgi:hypothetical protein